MNAVLNLSLLFIVVYLIGVSLTRRQCRVKALFDVLTSFVALGLFFSVIIYIGLEVIKLK